MEMQDTVYSLLRSTLPHVSLLSIAHRPSALPHHDLPLMVQPGGGWELLGKDKPL